MKRAAFVTGGASGIGLSICEHLARGVTVNNIAPSVVETPMVAQQQAIGMVPSSEKMAAGVPVGRMGTGDDIAAACLYLVSEEASYVTGQTVSVNGGSFVGW
jgi:2-hydroxycyclohexanecarboxyl-CoA dehydrogenase